MPSRQIRVSESVYDLLTELKRDEESYSDCIERLLTQDEQFSQGFGVFSDVDFGRHLE